MGLYNFQPRFVPFILSGAKTHTIRALRAHPDQAGNTIHLYSGLRHKGARLLMRAMCTRVEEITIRQTRAAKYRYEIIIDGQVLDSDEITDLANRDGFACFGDMMDFWKGRLPFTGHVIHWKAIGKDQAFKKGLNKTDCK